MFQNRFAADLRLAVRHLRRAPGYTATAVLTFAQAHQGDPHAVLRQG